jgi:hypothetical protein
MIYMLEVNMLVAAVVFGFASMFILAMFAWSGAQKLVRRERFAISRVSSRNHDRDSLHIA